MQKDIKKRVISVLIILSCCHFVLNAGYLKNNYYLNMEVRDGVEVSAKEQLAIYAILSNIPAVLIQNYTMDGNVIYITDSRFHPDFNNEARNSGAVGYIFHGEDEQYIEIIKSRYLEEMETVFYHEFGHYLDHKEKAWYHGPVVKSWVEFKESYFDTDKLLLWNVSEHVSIPNLHSQEYYANQFANMLMLKTGTVNEDSFTNKNVQIYIKRNLLSLTIKTWLKPNYLFN